MKVLGIYGSPRKGGNSDILLNKALEGAQSAGAEITSVLAAALKTLSGISGIASIKLRPSGRYLTGVVTVMVDGSETVADTERLRKEIRDVISRILEPVEDIIVVFRAAQDV
jgi:divalent metal cation (Fe/Co/Zn/Cd) transporter